MKQAQAREQESRLNDSREKRDLLMFKIREAYFEAKEAADSAAFAQAVRAKVAKDVAARETE